MKYLFTVLVLLTGVNALAQNNYSMYFDGVNDVIELEDSPSLDFSTNPYSVLFWVNIPNYSTTANGDSRSPISKGWNFELADGNNAGDIQFELQGGCDHESQNMIPENTWMHVAGVYDSETLYVYVNGILSGTQSCEMINNTTDFDLLFGVFFIDSFERWFLGNLDDIQIWNYDLSPEDIEYYMYCSPNGFEEELVGYWNFEEGSGSLVYDLSSNGINGVVNGAEWSTDVPILDCIYTVLGCTDPEANNYNPEATENDGSCEYLGCTNPIAENYDSTANVDDGSCIIIGCTDSDAVNFDSFANQDNGSCLYDSDYVDDQIDDAFEDGVNSVECPPCDNDCPGDYTGDNLVSVGDLLAFLILFGNQCD